MCGGEHHVRQLVLVLGRHGDDVRHTVQVGDVEQAVVRRAVVGRQPGAVHAEDDRQVLQRDVVDDHVVRALQEGGVDGADGAETHGRHPGGKQHGVFLRDADVVVLFGNGLLERLEAGAAWHGGGDPDDRLVLAAELDHRVAEHVLILRRCARFSRGTLTGLGIVWAGAVKFLGMLQGGVEALALLGDHVQDDWLLAALGELECLDQQRQVVSVDRAEVADSKFLKNQAAAESTASVCIERVLVMFEGHLRDGALDRLLPLQPKANGQFSGRDFLEEMLQIVGDLCCSSDW